VRRRIHQTLRATKIVLGDPTIPRPLRWGGAFGLLPIPGPVDEIVLLLIAAILAVFYREQYTGLARCVERQDVGLFTVTTSDPVAVRPSESVARIETR